jgi:basic membrane protein A
MKRHLLLVVVLAFAALGLAACGGDTFEIALITDKGDIDDKSFNQGAWEGVVAYAEENDISHQYYKPAEATDDAYLDAIGDAVDAGAKVIVTPGYLFETPVYSAQTLYPDVTFILLDGAPHTADYSTYKTESNVASVFYAEEESGWLAGYAAVMDGMTELGFMGGMALPAVQAFGYGFLQGADYAAGELEVDVNVLYHYTGDFAETDTNKATAAAMYQGGTEVIFAAGGSVGKSVMSAAAEADALVIGVDVDQRYDSETVITSATKGLAASVQLVLDAYYNDTFDTYGGKSTTFDATNDGIGLPTMVIGDDAADAFDRFESFSKTDYDAALALLVAGTVDPLRTITIADSNGVATAAELVSELGLTNVTVVSR